MKKITFFINSLDSGGSERQLLYLTKLLKEKLHIEIFCFKKGLLFNDFKKEGLNIISGNNNFFQYPYCFSICYQITVKSIILYSQVIYSWSSVNYF